MNEPARKMLGTQEALQRAEFDTLVHQVLGASVAPGIYALGDPQQIMHGGKVLQAQAAAVNGLLQQQRLGTVLLLRDITSEVQQSQARDHLLNQLSADIQQPLAGLAQQSALRQPPLVQDFAREISRHAAALQKMIVDMRELTLYSRQSARQVQRPLTVETLIWAVANDWKQIAQAASLTLQVQIEKKGLRVLGDESRLRLAIGNILDNAIKYTLPGGAVSLEIKDEINGAVHLRVRDNGVGISPADMEHLFLAFYRGTPVTPDGQIIRVPGMGQGLSIAKQIIEAHGGIVKVKSKLGVGTAVYIALPITAGVGFAFSLPEPSHEDGETVLMDNVDVEAVWTKK
jgi:two-component system sensor histidine kinase VicK